MSSLLTVTYKKRRTRKKDASCSSVTRDKTYSTTCCFCLSNKDKEEEFGKLIRKNGFTVHYFCLLFASGLCQRGRTDKEGIFGFLSPDIDKEITRGSRLRCEYCKNVGATIGCVVTSCRKKFHLVCGIENGSLHQFYDTFRSFCSDHRPHQSDVKKGKSKTVVCPMCMCNVTASCSITTMKSTCCKNAWFHRNCIQRYSLSAGLHFFKCPMCNDKNKFQSEMLEFGIYIPDQDASWETEPNAFNELLERHNRCDADKCNSPLGREHENASGKWELILCDYCGSQGSHVGCDGLYPINRKDQICQDCWDINLKAESEKKTGKKTSTTKTKSPISKSSKRIQLTDAQKKRRQTELQNQCPSDKISVYVTPCDTDVDVYERSDEEYHLTSSIEQCRKRQRLSLNRSRGSSVTANITLTDDSYGHSLTVSTSSSNSRVSVASSNTSTAYFPNFTSSIDHSPHSTSDSDSSESYSISDVTDLPERKSLTITWRGKKIHISKPKSSRDNIEDKEDDWTLKLQMTDSEDSDDERTKSRSSSHHSRFDDLDTPPVLVPIDEDVSIKCISPNYDSKLPPTLSRQEGHNKRLLTSKNKCKYSGSDDRFNQACKTLDEVEVDKLVTTNLPVYFNKSVNSTPNPSSSSISVISISSSDSDNGDLQQTKLKKNKYLSHLGTNNHVDLTNSDYHSIIRHTPPHLELPEVVILD
ncbi:uncharacterized protein LOC126820657 isoform X2 [Patella vulgata]|uniref:uncharacterized protein LOC126820657 isoform X2 n=1 Tax=Patella vulgata TaxID=6465 RepID=UPI0021804CB8|nr:uncharacterized protein LOC126820657 isoform X2 [Patella vulgata]